VPLVIATGVFALMSPLSITNPSALREPTTKSEEDPDQGVDDVSFCELDGDLQPWDKNGRIKQPITGLYDSAGVWVYGDFAMESPPRRPGFPKRQGVVLRD